MRRTPLALALLLCGLAGSAAGAAPPPLPEEPIPSVITLPDAYPQSWVMVHDLNFASIIDGRLLLVDTTSTTQPLKGIVRASQFANTLFAPDRREIYTAETFYSRLTQGERTDAITIWDAATLRPKGEIILPGGKRQQSVTYSGLFQFVNGRKWALVANFTPAQSITVVDLEGRKILGDIDLPGCSHIYPTGVRGFTTFCADGSLTSIQLDEKGQIASAKTVPAVQDIDRQPMFQMPAMVGSTAWFVTYSGQIKGFDLSGPVASPLKVKLSVGTAEGGAPEWRPGGWQVIAADTRAMLYVLMSPNGREGSHKDGGTEIWVVDPATGRRVNRIALQGHSTSISVTREAVPHLIVIRATGEVDVYDAASGAFVHSLGNTIGASPLLITPVP